MSLRHPRDIRHTPEAQSVLTPIRNVNDIITRAFNLYKANFGPLLAIMAIGYAAYFALDLLLGLLPLPNINLITFGLGTTTRSLRNSASPLWLALVYSFAHTAITSFALALTSGAVIYATLHRYLGQTFTIPQAYKYALKMGVGILILAILNPVFALAATLVWITGLNWISVILSLVLLIIFGPRLQIGQQALIAEQTTGFSAVKRSWQLIGNDRWSMSLNLLLMLMVRTVLPASIFISLLFLGATSTAAVIREFLLSLILMLITPLFDASFTIFYLHLRGEREQFDPNTLLASMDVLDGDKGQVG